MLTDWLMVIITSVYVVATILICIFNGKALKAAEDQIETAKEQIELMVKQQKEYSRPIVNISFDVVRSGLLCLSIENAGTMPAKNVSITINKEFIENLEKYEPQTNLGKLNETDIYLSPRQRMTIFISGQSKFESISQVVAKIDVKYNGEYEEHIEIDLKKYAFMLVYTGELGDIAQHFKKLQEEEKRFHDKLLKEIKNPDIQSIITFGVDGSFKSRVFKEVCINPGTNAEEISYRLNVDKEDVLNALTELEQVEGLIERVIRYDEEATQWVRK